MRKSLGDKIRKAAVFLNTSAVISYCYVVNNIVFAAKKTDVKEVTDGIDTLKQIALAIVGGIGAVFLCFGVVDFASAISNHDSSQQLAGIKKAVAGIVMIAVPTIVALFT